MPPVRRGSKGRGPVALALMGGVLVGLLVAATQFTRHGGADGSSGAVATLSAASSRSASSTDLAKLQSELTQARSERDAAIAEAGRLRDEAAKAAKQQSSPGSCPDRHTPWGPSAERDKTYPELAEFLKKVMLLAGCLPKAADDCPAAAVPRSAIWVLMCLQWSTVQLTSCAPTNSGTRLHGGATLSLALLQVAINNEVLVSVSNANYAWPGGMLQVWAENARRSGGQNDALRAGLGGMLSGVGSCMPAVYGRTAIAAR